MDLTNDKFKKSNSEGSHDNDGASTTTFKRNLFGRQKTCTYFISCFHKIV